MKEGSAPTWFSTWYNGYIKPHRIAKTRQDSLSDCSGITQILFRMTIPIFFAMSALAANRRMIPIE